MTDRISDDQFDREIRDFLAWQERDTAGAPSAFEMSARIEGHTGTGAISQRVAPRLVWPLLAGLVIVALLGVLTAGATLLRHREPVPSYEAVFLRQEVAAGERDVLVVGVDPAGNERQIARLPGAWVTYDIGVPQTGSTFLAPMGAVSPSGLLAIPTGGSDLMTHWELYDLHRPQAEPVVVPGIEQFVEQLRDTPYWQVDPRGGAFWGPGDRLAVVWYPCCGGEVHLQLTVIDGRTGDATDVAIPAGLVVLPYWASDGSGVFVGSSATDQAPPRILGVDGTVVDAPEAVATSTCRSTGGNAFPCPAPDDSMTVDIGLVRDPAQPAATVTDQATGTVSHIDGSFAGWLEVAQGVDTSEPTTTPEITADPTTRPTESADPSSSSPPIANGWIAYSTSGPVPGSTDTSSGSDIYLARAGETPRLIADRQHAGRDGSPGRNVCPAFSPDGRQLLYAVEASYGADIIVLGVAPNGDITDTVRFDGAGSRWGSCPAWSSDGTRIAFVDTTTGKVAVRAPDGSPPSGGPAGLPGDPSIEDFTRPREATDPLLSPAGDRSVRLEDCGVVVAAPDGTGARTIALDYCPYAIAAWSPDGRQILVMQDTGGFTIHAVSVDGQTQDSIVADGAVNGQRSWPGWGDVSWQSVLK